MSSHRRRADRLARFHAARDLGRPNKLTDGQKSEISMIGVCPGKDTRPLSPWEDRGREDRGRVSGFPSTAL